jgi:hypothetical protein
MLRAYLQLAFVLLVALSAPLILRYAIEQEDPDSQRHQQADLAAERERLRDYGPEVLFVGNSMLYTRIDRKEFRRLSNSRNLFVTNAATASACWYLYLKNVIAPSGAKPETVFVLFRDEILSWPEYRTGSFYTDYLESLQLPDEPVLGKVLYASQHNRRGLTFDIASGVQSIYGIDHQPAYFQRKLRNIALDITPLGAGKRERRAHMNDIFSLENLRRDLGGDDAALVTKRDSSESPTRFDPSKDASFLPHMIDVADEAGFRLCFYRVKTREDVDGTRSAKPLFSRYMEDLRTYIESRGALLIDESADPIPAEWYADGDHIAREHRTEYTQMFWEKVKGKLADAR